MDCLRRYHSRSIYTGEEFSQQASELARLHLAALLALASHKRPEVARRMQQLRVVAFLVKEIDAEYEASQRHLFGAASLGWGANANARGGADILVVDAQGGTPPQQGPAGGGGGGGFFAQQAQAQGHGLRGSLNLPRRGPLGADGDSAYGTPPQPQQPAAQPAEPGGGPAVDPSVELPPPRPLPAGFKLALPPKVGSLPADGPQGANVAVGAPGVGSHARSPPEASGLRTPPRGASANGQAETLVDTLAAWAASGGGAYDSTSSDDEAQAPSGANRGGGGAGGGQHGGESSDEGYEELRRGAPREGGLGDHHHHHGGGGGGEGMLSPIPPRPGAPEPGRPQNPLFQQGHAVGASKPGPAADDDSTSSDEHDSDSSSSGPRGRRPVSRPAGPAAIGKLSLPQRQAQPDQGPPQQQPQQGAAGKPPLAPGGGVSAPLALDMQRLRSASAAAAAAAAASGPGDTSSASRGSISSGIALRAESPFYSGNDDDGSSQASASAAAAAAAGAPLPSPASFVLAPPGLAPRASAAWGGAESEEEPSTPISRGTELVTRLSLAGGLPPRRASASENAPPKAAAAAAARHSGSAPPQQQQQQQQQPSQQQHLNQLAPLASPHFEDLDDTVSFRLVQHVVANGLRTSTSLEGDIPQQQQQQRRRPGPVSEGVSGAPPLNLDRLSSGSGSAPSAPAAPAAPAAAVSYAGFQDLNELLDAEEAAEEAAELAARGGYIDGGAGISAPDASQRPSMMGVPKLKLGGLGLSALAAPGGATTLDLSAPPGASSGGRRSGRGEPTPIALTLPPQPAPAAAAGVPPLRLGLAAARSPAPEPQQHQQQPPPQMVVPPLKFGGAAGAAASPAAGVPKLQLGAGLMRPLGDEPSHRDHAGSSRAAAGAGAGGGAASNRAAGGYTGFRDLNDDVDAELDAEDAAAEAAAAAAASAATRGGGLPPRGVPSLSLGGLGLSSLAGGATRTPEQPAPAPSAGKPPTVPKLSFGSAAKTPETRAHGGGGGGLPPKVTPLKLNLGLMGQAASPGGAGEAQEQQQHPQQQHAHLHAQSPPPTAHGTPAPSAAPTAPSLTPEEFLDREKSVRRIYADSELHVAMLTLLLQLLSADSNGDALDKTYCDQLPLEQGKPNVPFFLGCHLSHPQNAPLLPALVARAHTVSRGAVRLLRLLVPALFDAAPLAKRERIARGAFASVFRVELPPLGGSAQSGPGAARGHVVALKAVDAPASIHDPCAPHELFHEVCARAENIPMIDLSFLHLPVSSSFPPAEWQ